MGAGSAPEFLTSTVEKGFEQGSLTNIEKASPLGPPKLVGGDRHHVDIESVDVDLLGCEPLNRVGVDVHVGIRLFDGLGNGSDILDQSGLIVDQHHRYDGCSRVDSTDNCVGVNRTVVVDFDDDRRVTEPTQNVDSLQNRLVLRGHRDHA